VLALVFPSLGPMKTITKTTLCGLYKYSGAMFCQEALARWTGRSFLVILLFHRVTDEIPEDGLTVSTARFRRICRMLQRRFRVIGLGEVLRLVRLGQPLPRRTVAITFDDCYRSNLFAAEVLAEHGLPACFFLPTSFIGTECRFDWDRGLKPLANLTWDDVREMTRMGFDIGSHTASHANLARIPAERAWRELVDSKAELEDRLGRPVHWFAYPFGGRNDFGPEQIVLVQEAGYDCCFSGHGGFIYHDTDPRLLPREDINYFRSILNLELHLAGCLDWVYALKRRLGLQRAEEGHGNSVAMPAHGDDGLLFEAIAPPAQSVSEGHSR
jgi:peptidoglycan/xylan/chitin deacetylase (PgdA/CDA1 family)